MFVAHVISNWAKTFTLLMKCDTQSYVLTYLLILTYQRGYVKMGSTELHRWNYLILCNVMYQCSGVGTFYNLVRTSKLGPDWLVQWSRIYYLRLRFYMIFQKLCPDQSGVSVYVPTPLQSSLTFPHKVAIVPILSSFTLFTHLRF